MSRGEKGDLAIHRPSSGTANPSCRGRIFVSLNKKAGIEFTGRAAYIVNG
jgi:hypothetical protein